MLLSSLVDWSRLMFAMTAMYHWLFVPLTLGMGLVMAIAESKYLRTKEPFWKETAKFWQKIFGINFAIGVATGIILEFEFGTNWSNYSHFVGDIFGAPLAIEGIVAFFMEATFFVVMFFGWDKVSDRFHHLSTWMTLIGATLSAWWILVANGWMQNPAGMHFNPDTVRNEMIDFAAVAFNPVAVSKFFHSVISSWMLGSIVAMGICGYYLLRNRRHRFALESIKIASTLGLIASVLTILTGHLSANHVAEYQPMKLAAMENLHRGQTGAPLSIIGLPNDDAHAVLAPEEDPWEFNLEMPKVLSFLAFNDFNAYVPGMRDIIEGGYTQRDGTVAMSADERIASGKVAIQALADYKAAKKIGDEDAAAGYRQVLDENFANFGYGFLDDKAELIPNVMMLYITFRIMVYLSVFFLAVFLLAFIFSKRSMEKPAEHDMRRQDWFSWVMLVSIPLVYICSQCGWILAEVGRQPWTIQGVLPVGAAISDLNAESVQLTFWIFVVFFTAMLIADLCIMVNAIKKGPKTDEGVPAATTADSVR